MTMYKDAGVNLPAGNAISRFAAGEMSHTHGISPFIEVHDHSRGHFRAPRTFNFVGLSEGTEFIPAVDGIGTKVILAGAALTYNQAARDLYAMIGGDITRWGGKPLVMLNILDVSSLGEVDSDTYRAAMELFRGLRQVLTEQEVVGLSGETAELGVCVGSEIQDALLKFNWGGFMLGLYHPVLQILGDEIQPGDEVVAFGDVFRSNGISAVRRAFKHPFGDKWWNNPDAYEAIRQAATPSKIYDDFLTDMNGWNAPDLARRIPFTGIAHISGGGIGEKFGDILFPTGHSAELDDLFELPEIMHKCADWTNKIKPITDREVYDTWNGGQGLIATMRPQFLDDCLVQAKLYGIPARPCGRVVPSSGTPRLRIHSKYRGEILDYEPE